MNFNRTLTATAIAGALLAVQPAIAAGGVSDTWKEASITTAYTLNEHLDPFDIDIEVRGDTAFLQGTVESGVERDLAARIATSVDGISRVENNLRIDAGNAGSGTRDRFARAVEDATITARIESQLLWNRSTSALDVSVSTTDGVVTLGGTVRSESEVALVERIARHTDGVVRVDSQLGVEQSAQRNTAITDDLGRVASAIGADAADAWISTKVSSALLYNRQVDGMDIGVQTRGGIVTLSGAVSHRAELERALAIARSIAGVKDVRSTVAIEPASS